MDQRSIPDLVKSSSELVEVAVLVAAGEDVTHQLVVPSDGLASIWQNDGAVEHLIGWQVVVEEPSLDGHIDARDVVRSALSVPAIRSESGTPLAEAAVEGILDELIEVPEADLGVDFIAFRVETTEELALFSKEILWLTDFFDALRVVKRVHDLSILAVGIDLVHKVGSVERVDIIGSHVGQEGLPLGLSGRLANIESVINLAECLINKILPVVVAIVIETSLVLKVFGEGPEYFVELLVVPVAERFSDLPLSVLEIIFAVIATVAAAAALVTALAAAAMSQVG